jgi:thiamine-monophosphate kinase
MVQRSGARAGDRIVVTGTIGDAALGLRLRNDTGDPTRWRLDQKMQRHFANRYLVPEPRNVLAEGLRGHASAGMDVSDGLAGDLSKLCRASGVAAEIEVSRVPLSKAAQAALAAEPELIETILTGGDDFEIVATVPAGALGSLQRAARAARVPLTEIGRIATGQGIRFVTADGKALRFARASFSHF